MNEIIYEKTLGPWRIVATIQMDDMADLSYLGEYSDKPEAFAIERHDGSDHRNYRYFNPGECHHTVELAQEVFERMTAYNLGHWQMVTVSTTVYRNGIELGSDCMSGVESDSEQYLLEIAKELTSDAIAEARTNLKDLKEAL